jgi:protein-S-isoprenylcysteine O-methyltransferase Ste14
MTTISLSSHILVLLQFSGIVLSVFPVNHTGSHHKYFLIFSAAGLLLGVITLMYNKIGNFRVYPEIKPGGRLIITGPYRFVRHPMYTSLILLLAGMTLYLNHLTNYIGLVIVIASVFLKSKREEQLLIKIYPEYMEYMNETSGFLPFV